MYNYYRIDVRERLNHYGVKFPDALDAQFRDMIIPRCGPRCIDSLCEKQKEDNKCLCTPPNFTLNQCLKLSNELKSSMMPLQPNIVLWKYTLRCQLLSKYVDVFVKQQKSTEKYKITLLASALRDTSVFFSKALRGNTRFTLKDYSVDRSLKFKEFMDRRVIAKQLNEISQLIGGQGDIEQINRNIKRFTDMLILFQNYGHIAVIIEVFEIYEMEGCLSDTITAELRHIYNECEEEGCNPEISEQYCTIIEDAFQLTNSRNHMMLFKEIKDCKNFYIFLKDQFSSDNGDMHMDKTSFQSWYEIISNQLQSIDFERQILHHLSTAFDLMMPFFDKKQTVKELISKVKTITTTSEFKELRTVRSNMHHIERWSSLAEVNCMIM